MKLRNRKTLEPSFLIKLQCYFNEYLTSADHNESVDTDSLGMEKLKMAPHRVLIAQGFKWITKEVLNLS